MRTGIVFVVVGGFTIGACGGVGSTPVIGSGGAPPGASGADGGASASSSGGSSSGGASSSSGGGSSGSSSGSGGSSGSSSGGAGSSGAVDGGTGAPCYSEPYFPTANVADLAAGFDGSNWLEASITTMQRRYPTGYFVLNAEQNDPQLPQFVDASSWSALMSSLLTVLDAETAGWDFDNASANAHPFVILDTMKITAPSLTTWAQGEILQYITDAATQTYDQTELGGQQGTYDGIFLFDAINSAANGLAAATAVGDQVPFGIPARDGVAAHLYYMELYLRAGRTSHPAEYAAIQTDPGWQQLVRYEWARGHFWDGQAKPNANLQIAVSPIWANVDAAAALDEIQEFTGEAPDAVACHP
jgi:hypothetical protein